jgi:hypothetical protein
MFSAYKEMQKNGQNEIWLIDYFESKLSEEIVEFVDWNDSLFKVKTSL